MKYIDFFESEVADFYDAFKDEIKISRIVGFISFPIIWVWQIIGIWVSNFENAANLSPEDCLTLVIFEVILLAVLSICCVILSLHMFLFDAEVKTTVITLKILVYAEIGLSILTPILMLILTFITGGLPMLFIMLNGCVFLPIIGTQLILTFIKVKENLIFHSIIKDKNSAYIYNMFKKPMDEYLNTVVKTGLTTVIGSQADKKYIEIMNQIREEQLLARRKGIPEEGLNRLNKLKEYVMKQIDEMKQLDYSLYKKQYADESSDLEGRIQIICSD